MSDQTIHPALKPGTEQVKIVLNGREVTGFKGETIITVAAREDVYVPHYCWHPSLSVAGNCRLCLVEVHMPGRDGKLSPAPKPVIGCQTPISAGMHVFTDSALAKECQNGMMEFLLANHPLDCPICDRGGECMLQRYSMEYGTGHARMADKKRKFTKPQADPLIDIERNRCIMCTRCVRFCDEVAGEHVMGVFDRGEGNYIGTFGQGPVSNILSGNVIDICPVGCLTSKPFRFKARVWELLQTQSTSIWDASGAKVTHWTRNGKLYRTTPPSRKIHDGYTVNEDTEEFIDNITRFGSDFSRHESRWDESRIRIGGSPLPSSFTEAVRQAAEGLGRVKSASGGDSIAVLVSPRATMEEGYLAAKFARTVLRTDNIDWRVSLDTQESADAATVAIQHADGDLEDGFDAAIVLSGDYLHTTPVFAMRVREHARLNGKPLVLLGHHHDPYLSAETAWRFHCQPGAIAKVLSLLAKAIGGTAAAKDELAGLLNVTAERVGQLVELLSASYRKGLLIHNLDDMGSRGLASEVPAALGLKAALGAAWGYIPTLRARNAFGLYAVGAQPGVLPSDEKRVRQAWGVDANVSLPTDGGLAAHGLIEAIESGRIRALVALGADTLHAYADRERLIAALQKLEFFVLSDLFESDFAAHATVFLAAASNLEKDGTYADLEGNLARLTEAEPPAGGSRPEWEALTGIATLMGSDEFDYESVADVFAEMMPLIAPGFQGSFQAMNLRGPRNDVSISDPGGARKHSPLYNPGDYRIDGAHLRWKGEAVEATGLPAPSAPAADGEFLVTWGAHGQGDDYHLNNASIAEMLKATPYAEINPADAKGLGIEDPFARHRAILHINGESHEVDVIVRRGPAPGVLYVPEGLGPISFRNQVSAVTARLEVVAREPVEVG